VKQPGGNVGASSGGFGWLWLRNAAARVSRMVGTAVRWIEYMDSDLESAGEFCRESGLAGTAWKGWAAMLGTSWKGEYVGGESP